MAEITIGIDLGTRYAQLAAEVPGRGVQVIPNRWGQMKTSSIVACTGDGLVVGEEAARLALTEPDSAWWDMKRHLGTDWVARIDGRSYTPEELLLPLISLLREDAEAHFGCFISSCVLAVPAHFSFPERGAMARIAQMAGFDRVRIVNEPTAAALSIGGDGRFLIMDFGAGTLDLSLVEGDGGVFQVVESQGRRDIGGIDIDKILAEWLCRKSGVPFSRSDDPRALLMMAEAESLKIALSSANVVSWRIPSGFPGGGKSIDISRSDFEGIISNLIDEVVAMVWSMWVKHDPHRFLMVGGSSRIPMLRRVLSGKVYAPEKLRSCPEDAVVIGSALYATQGKERLLIDVLSRSLGVMNSDGGVVPLLGRGTPLPAEAKKSFTACGSGSIEITIVQGEGRVKSLNRVLQTIRVDNVANGEVVEIFFRIDGGGLLNVEVRRKKKISRQTITLESDETGVTSCDLLAEIRIREDKIAKLSMSFPDNFHVRLQSLLSEARALKGEDPSLQWQVLEVLDKMISEMEQVMTS